MAYVRKWVPSTRWSRHAGHCNMAMHYGILPFERRLIKGNELARSIGIA